LAGAGEVRLVAGDPADAVDGEVGGVSACGKVFGADGVLEAGLLEGAVPGFDPLLHPAPPLFGHGSVHEEHDRLFRSPEAADFLSGL